MKTVTLNISDAANRSLSALPNYTKSPFASTTIEAVFELVGQSLEVLCHEEENVQTAVVDFSRLCAEAFGLDCMRVAMFDRGRVQALQTAHGTAFDVALTNVALTLGLVLAGAPKVFRGMLDPITKAAS